MTTVPRLAVPSALDAASDALLADRAADGDVRAFEVLVRRHGPLMRVHATRILGSNDETDDVVQESFITAWRQLPTLENGAAVKSWLMRICGRKSIDRVRARRDHADITETDAAAPATLTPHHVAETQEQAEALARCLADLPDDQRRCWTLRELGEYSYTDIAEELDLPVSTVRGLLARARKTLLRELEDWR